MRNARRVFAGVDGSVGSLQALRVAVAEARRRGGQLTAVVAWTPPGGEMANRGRSPLVQVWVTAARSRLMTAFEEAMGGVPEDLDVCLEVARGTPGRVLVASTDHSEDLLVVGRGDGHVLHRMLNGSVSRYCVAHARCQVLVVPPPPLLRHSRRSSPWVGTPDR